MKVLTKIKDFIGYHLYFAYKFTENRSNNELSQYYKEQITLKEVRHDKVLVVMIDGKMRHGGIADRLRGIVSIYQYAKRKGLKFKIYHSFPFPLTDFIEPHKLDWLINEEELLFDNKHAKPIFLESLNILGETWTQSRLLDIHTKGNKSQYHLYTNIDLYPKLFSQDFNWLFKPSQRLSSELRLQERLIGEEYISVTLRFQQLLGDFVEGDYPVLSERNKNQLVEKCLSKVEEIYKNSLIKRKILVTSDSNFFLQKVTKYDFVHIISGEVVHMDYTIDSPTETYLKSFLDLYMISKAKKVYLLLSGSMYRSGFARRAALINNVTYEEVFF